MQNRLLTIGNNIKTNRKKQNLTQIELAVEVGIDRAYLSEIENGKANISVNILYAIADALHTDIKDFFNTNQS